MPCVNVYYVTRHFGGPEEGGWWFNLSLPVAHADKLTDEEAAELQDTFEKLYRSHEDGDIYSVNGGIEVYVSIEEEPFESATKEKPRYE